MKIEVKKTIGPSLLKSILFIIIGLLLTFMADATLVSISYFLGGILCAMGAVAIIQFFKTKEEASFIKQFNIVYGIVTILAGIILIARPSIIGSLIPICLGILMIISSAFKIQQTLALKEMKSAYWKGSLVTSFLGLICGLVILFNPFKTASIVLQMVGIFILIYAILDIISTLMIKKTTTIVHMELSSSNTQEKKNKKVKNAKIVKEVEKKEEK